MAAQGLSVRARQLPMGSLAYGLAAALAAALSLAAALLAFGGGATSTPPLSSSDELRLRNERIAFYELRAMADSLDFVSLNTLAWQYLQRARETGDVGDYDRAESAAARSLSLLPDDNFNGTLALASVRLVQHKFAAALGLAEQAIALKPSNPAALGLKGDALVGLGRYDEAGRAFQAMVDIEPALPALSRLAGLAFIEGERFNAEDFWKQASDRAQGLPLENRAWARTQLGTLYMARGDLARAERQYQLALGLYPDYVHARAGVAAVRAAQARWDEAIQLYRSVQERLPQTEYVIALGDVYAKAGRTADAALQYALVEAIARLLQANGINTDLQLALFYADHDQAVEHALSLAEAAYAASPGVYAADAYAWALYKAGRLQEADIIMTEALRLGTPEARFYYHAGLIRLGLGDRDAGVAQLAKALRLNPHFSILQAERARRALEEARAGR